MPSGSDEKKRRKIKEGDKVAEIFRTALNLEDANIIAKKYRGSAYFKALMSGTNSPAVTSRSCFKNIVIYTGR